MDQICLLTPELAGREFDPPLGANRVRQLVDSGELAALRTPAGWRLIPRAEVLRLVEERRRRATANTQAE